MAGWNSEVGIFKLIIDGDLEGVERILDKNPYQLEEKDHFREGQTPIIYAAKHGKLSILKKLISLGANLDHQACGRNAWLGTALHSACYAGHIDCAEELVLAGAGP